MYLHQHQQIYVTRQISMDKYILGSVAILFSTRLEFAGEDLVKGQANSTVPENRHIHLAVCTI